MDAVSIQGKTYRLDANLQIGNGGEGTVFKVKVDGEEVALKIYHEPNLAREQKLKALTSRTWNLPQSKITMPLDLALNYQKQVAGFTMPYLGIGFSEVRNLGNTKFRPINKINARNVAEIFLDGAKTLRQIHNQGFCIGDFNDLNVFFRGREMLYIEVDSWQFPNNPCFSGHQDFLHPDLYPMLDKMTNWKSGMELPFKAKHDIYSMWVMLFRSLYCVHPFGGTFKGMSKIRKRTENRISVFNPQVIYPEIAIKLDTYGSNTLLISSFQQVFDKGCDLGLDIIEQGLQELLSSLDNDGNYIGKQVTHHAVVTHIKTSMGVKAVEVLATRGPIVFSKLVEDTLWVIAFEQGQTVLYEKHPTRTLRRVELFAEISGAKFEIFDRKLLVNPPNEDTVMIVDISTNQIKPISTITTAIFSGSRKAIFRATEQAIYKIRGGNLIKCSFMGSNLIEIPIRNVLNNQTWFKAQTVSVKGVPTELIAGYSQFFREQLFWVGVDENFYDISLSKLDTTENLIDVAVFFSSTSILIRRITQYNGHEWLYTDVVDLEGELVYTSKVKMEDFGGTIHGNAYYANILLHATDEGILQEKPLEDYQKAFESTKGIVKEGDTLYLSVNGLLAVNHTTVRYIEID